jgi:hypothetical protein
MEEMSLCGREEDFAPFAGDECDCALLGTEVSIMSGESSVSSSIFPSRLLSYPVLFLVFSSSDRSSSSSLQLH